MEFNHLFYSLFPMLHFYLKNCFFFNSGPFKLTDLVTNSAFLYYSYSRICLVKTSSHQVFAV